jgi:hypothetical protein
MGGTIFPLANKIIQGVQGGDGQPAQPAASTEPEPEEAQETADQRAARLREGRSSLNPERNTASGSRKQVLGR